MPLPRRAAAPDDESFDDLFARAVAAVGDEYVRVPIAGAVPVVRERAFAYELYHQLRLTCHGLRYTLTGELEKATHPDLLGTNIARLAPDLLLHTPGTREGNYVAVEIKGGWPRAGRFRKDLKSLSVLRDTFRYRRLIYLIYGIEERQVRPLVARMRQLATNHAEPADLRLIELWVRTLDRREPAQVTWSE